MDLRLAAPRTLQWCLGGTDRGLAGIRRKLRCIPLAIADGAGSGSQNSIGIGVMGGMISATVLGVLFSPVLFVAVQRLFEGGKNGLCPIRWRSASRRSDYR
ncbi:hypothetical protein HFN54_35425 [Rhizobium leguminosarum]|nr:hypothetical protein [Rhizobium leguminosarum]